MAGSAQSVNTNLLTIRQVLAYTPSSLPIPPKHILIAQGNGVTNWSSISSIFEISTFNAVRGTNGSTFYADQFNNILNVSTTGVQGLLEAYVDPAVSTLMLSNAVAPVQIGLTSVPFVSRVAASNVPTGQTITFSTSQSTLKFMGVGDIQLSTITDLRSVFISISSFTASGYADLSAEARAWRPYVYSTVSTNAGYGASFISTIPYSTATWNWLPVLDSNRLMSTAEAYPNYTTGDVYFSSISFRMDPFLRYIHPNSTTRMMLEVQPNYFFDRMFLGTSSPITLVKEISSYVQYQPPGLVPGRLLPYTTVTNWITSQQSNLYASNAFNTPLKMELNTAALMSNALTDGPAGGYYTLCHRIVGGMASLTPDPDCGCDYLIYERSGFSNQVPWYDNRMSQSNSVFLNVTNRPGAAPPMPGP